MKDRGLWAVLESCPFPQDVLKLGIEKVANLIAKASRRRTKATQKALKVHQAAGESIGLKTIGLADTYRVKVYLEEVRSSETQLKDIQKQMGVLLREVPYARYILSIEGIGILSCAVFLVNYATQLTLSIPKG
jgi:transposase